MEYYKNKTIAEAYEKVSEGYDATDTVSELDNLRYMANECISKMTELAKDGGDSVEMKELAAKLESHLAMMLVDARTLKGADDTERQ